MDYKISRNSDLIEIIKEMVKPLLCDGYLKIKRLSRFDKLTIIIKLGNLLLGILADGFSHRWNLPKAQIQVAY